MQIAALGILLLGQLVLVGRPDIWVLGTAELFTLLAILLWAVEAVAARRVMAGVSARAAALGRMGFGALAMLGFLAFSGRMDTLATMNSVQWGWVVLTSFFLLGYVTSYYGALKHSPATLGATVLTLGSVMTSLLYAIFSARTYATEQVAGFLLIAGSAALWLYTGHRWSKHAIDLR